VLGANALFATAYGNVGSSIYYALGLVTAFSLGLTPVVFVITGFFFFCTAATYTEATTMYPEAGGSSSFARHAFNEFISFFAAWGQMLNYIITVAISAFFVPHYIGGLFWEPLRSSPGDIIFGALVVVALVIINVIGIKESARLNIVLAVVDFLTQLLLVVIGFLLVFSPDVLASNIHLGTVPTWENFILAIPIGMIAYTGIETISNMSEEAREATKTIPIAINRVRLAVFAIYFTLPAIALSALPVVQAKPGDQAVTAGVLKPGEYYSKLGLPEEVGGYAGDPVLGIVKSLDLGPLQNAGELYVGLLAATILFLATNAGLIGVSRLVYSMGIHRQVPDNLRRLHPRFRTPWIGIIVFGGIAILTILPGEAVFLGNMYAFGAMLSFTIAHMAVLRLRAKVPDEKKRTYKGPWNIKIGSYDLPLFAVLGGLGTSFALIVVTALHPAVALAGIGWLIFGIVIYALYRRSQGLDLSSTHRVATPQPVIEQEAEYRSILVHFGEGEYDAHIVATAMRLASPNRRGIHILVTIAVPHSLPLNAKLPQQESNAASTIEQAKIRGGARVSGQIERVRPGQTGRRIIQTAKSIRASAVLLPLPNRAYESSIFGRTLETVLAERPCRVIVESSGGRQTTENETNPPLKPPPTDRAT
jgi:APA family basic amino acid/polyamine antiporter